MKKLSYFLSVACAAMMLAGCSSDVDDFVAQGSDGMIRVSVELPSNDTRVEFKNNELTNLVWSTDWDCLYIIDEAKGNIGSMNMLSGNGTSKAVFGLDAYYVNQVKDDVTYRLLNKESFFDNSVKQVTKNYDNQVQTAFNDVSKLQSCLIMMSDPITGADLKAGKKVTMRHQSSILKLNLRTLPVTFDGAKDFDITFYTNYESVYTPITAHTKVYGTMGTTGENFVYLAFDPANDAEPVSEIAFNIKSDFKETLVRALTLEGKQYEPGVIYTAELHNRQDAAGEVDWYTVPEPIFTKIFTDFDDWTVIGGTDMGTGWNMVYVSWDPVIQKSKYRLQGFADDSNDHLLVSKPIKLMPYNNTVEIHHYVSQLPNEEKPKCVSIVVRSVDVDANGAVTPTSEWTPVVGNMIFNDVDCWGEEFVSSGKLTIEGFNDKTVQVALKYNKGNNANLTWRINDILVRGE